MDKDKSIKNSDDNFLTRRNFIRDIAINGGSVILFGSFGCHSVFTKGNGNQTDYSMILVDYSICTGCRTCEAVCSAFNHREEVNGESLPGLGNPYYSNIRVNSYNPDVDIPNVCAMCSDTPCIEACPVSPDKKTGRKALYRDDAPFAIKNDPGRCIACGSCADACRLQRRGIIVPNPETKRPERMCTLCGGEPQCVEYCPYGALSHVSGKLEGEFYGMHPDRIAKKLTEIWYKKAEGGLK